MTIGGKVDVAISAQHCQRAISNQQSAIGNWQLAISNWQSAISIGVSSYA
jgi:hypothetical protein